MTSETTSKSLSSKQKIVVGTASLLAGASLLIGSMAYFTDRENADATAQAGIVDISITENWQDILNFNPGDISDLSYSISNDGNKSVDIRETIVVKSSVPLTDADQTEFEVYKRSDVTQAANGSYIPNDGATPITTGADRVIADDGSYVKYSIAEYTLNGTGTGAEEEDGITETSKDMDYVLVFKNTSKNAFQEAELSVELLAEAKQHRNTDANDWVTLATENVTIGGESVNTVPQK